MALTQVSTKGIKDAEVKTADIADENVTLAKLEHGTSDNNGKFLRANNGADPTWETVDTSNITVASEGTDTTCFPVFTTAATGTLGPKTSTNLTFNSNTGRLEAGTIYTTSGAGKICAQGPALGGGLTDAVFLDNNGINLSSTSAGPRELRFGGTGAGDYIAFKSDGSFSGTTTFVLPDGDGSADQVLKTDGSGNLDWTDSGAGAVGGSTDKIFWENGQTVTADYTITNNHNAGTFGPVTINSGVTVTVGDGEYWTII